MTESVYEQLRDERKLPSPSGVALELMRLVDDEASTIDQITRMVESDPALAARVLKTVNSSLCGASRTVASVETAVKLLGRNVVKNLALGIGLLGANRSGVSKIFDFQRFWSTSLARAVAARALAQQSGPCPPDEAFTVALISNIGSLALATCFPEEYDSLLDASHAWPTAQVLEAERRAFGIQRNELSALMMDGWGVAKVFCDVVRLLESPHSMKDPIDARTTAIRDLLGKAERIALLLASPTSEELVDNAIVELEVRGRSPEELRELVVHLEEEWQRLAEVLSIQTPREGVPQCTTAAPKHDYRRVLLVDDDASMLKLMTAYLTAEGYEVAAAADGAEALEIIHTHGFRLIVTDWHMPKMDGLELCRALRASEGIGFVYIIVVTADSDDKSLTRAFDAGADDFLVKPVRKHELFSRLKAGVRAVELEAGLAAQQRATHRANAELARVNDQLQYLATTDVLTGLGNRREALKRLNDHWAMSSRDGRSLSCLLLDIDHFKRCNDIYGHDFGDVVLQHTAKVLQKQSRAGERPFRLGGEEFLVLCPSADSEDAAKGAERLRAAVEAHIIEFQKQSTHVTVSIGVAQRNELTETPEQLLKQADEALYEAKRSGRNRVCVYSPAREPNDEPGQPGGTAESCLAVICANPIHGTTGSVLIADPNEATRNAAARLLQATGFAVHAVTNGVTAMDRACTLLPDVIVMSVQLPDIDGFDCTRQMATAAVTNHIPVVLTNAHANANHVELGLSAGASEVIDQAVPPNEFTQRVRAIAELARDRKLLAESNAVRGEQARAMSILFELSRRLATLETLDEIAYHVSNATAELLNARRVSIMVPDAMGKNLRVAGAVGIAPDIADGICVPVGMGICGSVFASGEPIIQNTSVDVKTGSRYESAIFASAPLASRALRLPTKVLGVLNITERHDGDPFDPRETEYLDLICNIAATSLEGVQSIQARDHAYSAIVLGLASLAEHRDAETGRHLERVTRFALVLATQMQTSAVNKAELTDEFLKRLERAMPLHDIGKVAIPDAILRKPGELTATEFAVVKEHTTIGAKAIEVLMTQAPEATFLSLAKEIALSHHEWYDGNGYPQKLVGRKIPLAARIAAVADVYDALTTRRPYKEAYPHRKAVEIICSAAGTQFDPQVVEAFLREESTLAKMAKELADAGGEDAPWGVIDSHSEYATTQLV